MVQDISNGQENRPLPVNSELGDFGCTILFLIVKKVLTLSPLNFIVIFPSRTFLLRPSEKRFYTWNAY